MKNSLIYIIIAVLISSILLIACKGTYKVIESSSKNEVVKSDFSTEDSLYAIVKPYKESLGESMSEVLNVSLVDMEIGLPEGLLGDFVADLVLTSSRSKSEEFIDMCVLNNGGLRTPILKGDVTRGMLYELMPFENEMVVLELDGAAMNEMIAHIANKSLSSTNAKGGVPVSGIRIRMGGGVVNDVMIGVAQYDESKTYTVVTSDYLAGGGDNMKFFSKAVKVTNLNIKLRDLIIEEVIAYNEKGIKLNAQLDGRIYIAE